MNKPTSLLKRIRLRRAKDAGSYAITGIFSCFTFATLIWMIVYIFQNGAQYLTWNFITGDYSKHSYTIRSKNSTSVPVTSYFDNTDNVEAYSSRWGIGFEDGKNGEEEVIYIVSIQQESPFNHLVDSSNEAIQIHPNYFLSSLLLENDDGSIDVYGAKEGAKALAEGLNNAHAIIDGTLTSQGKGIRGSLLTTLCLIGFSLLFSLPLGIGGAIYLALYAKDHVIARGIRTLIDVTGGIPSIIFGLAGALIFIPFVNGITSHTGGSLFSGALTLSIMLLPTIVKTVEESINVVPSSFSQASLALGASKVQTVFKVVLPNALPGILSASLLSIGRIIGESAALIFAMGATIGDNVSLLDGHASLAVHIWTCLQGESPQYGSACAISIIILIIVLILSLSVKWLSYRINKKKGRA